MDKEYTSEIIAKEIAAEVEKLKVNLKQLNIMVVGKTGVGKSTLINGLFGDDLAPTGIGLPITQDAKRYTKSDYPFTIWDWPGFELEGENGVKDLLADIKKVVQSGIKTKDVNEMVHCILYCVSATSHRFEDAEIEIINQFLSESKKNKVPVILVITQACIKRETEELIAQIENENIKFSGIVPVLVNPVEFEEYTKKAYGLNHLIDAMKEVLAEDVRETLECVQISNYKSMQKRARNWIASYCANSVALAYKPAFNANSLIEKNVPILIRMIARINTIFNIEVPAELVRNIVNVVFEDDFDIRQANLAVNIVKFLEPTAYIGYSAYIGVQLEAITAAVGEEYLAIASRVFMNELNVADINEVELKQAIKDKYKSHVTQKNRKLKNKKESVEDEQ